MLIDSFDQHIEDCSPQWPVPYGVFEKVAHELMSEEEKLKFDSALFVTWLHLHQLWNGAAVWEKMKRDLKNKELV